MHETKQKLNIVIRDQQVVSRWSTNKFEGNE